MARFDERRAGLCRLPPRTTGLCSEGEVNLGHRLMLFILIPLFTALLFGLSSFATLDETGPAAFSLSPALLSSKAFADEVPAPAAKGRSLVDRNGHDEAWWKERVRKWEAKREAATLKLGETEVALARLKSKNLPLPIEQAETEQLIKEANLYRKDAVEANEMVQSILPEEARKAGAPPGWLQNNNINNGVSE